MSIGCKSTTGSKGIATFSPDIIMQTISSSRFRESDISDSPKVKADIEIVVSIVLHNITR